MKNNNMNDSLNILLSAKKATILAIFSMIFMIISLTVHMFYMNHIDNKILDRIKTRDILVLTNSGMINGKTTPDFKIIARQFAQVTFNSSLNYNPNDILPQLNFMQIYADRDIFKNYKDMVQTTVSKNTMENKLYYASIDSENGIDIITVKPNQKYTVKIKGTRLIISDFKTISKKILLTLTIERDINTGINNIFGLKITTFNLKTLS